VRIGTSGWNGFRTIVLGDVDGDGRADLVATAPDGTLWLYPNSGRTTLPYAYQQRALIGTGWQAFHSTAMGDLDHDGLGDLVVRKPDGSLWAYYGDGTDPVRAPIRVGTSGWQGFDSYAIDDIDGDGAEDLIVRRTDDGALFVYPDSGVPTAPYVYQARRQVGTGYNVFDVILVGDVDGDGLADLVARKPSGVLYLYLNSGRAANPYPGGERIQIGTGFSRYPRLLLADVNGDGLADLIGFATDGTATVYPNSRDVEAPFRAGTRLTATGWNAYSALMAGDVDHDGHADLLGIKSSDGSLWHFRNTGTNTIALLAPIKADRTGWQAYRTVAM
jgi:hypothetical protein